MKIQLAVIQPEDHAEIMRLTEELRSAVSAGDMDGADAATNNLMAATKRSCSVKITEDEWRRFFNQVRSNDNAIKSDYVIPGQLCRMFFPDATPETFVLQLPVDQKEVDDV